MCELGPVFEPFFRLLRRPQIHPVLPVSQGLSRNSKPSLVSFYEGAGAGADPVNPCNQAFRHWEGSRSPRGLTAIDKARSKTG